MILHFSHTSTLVSIDVRIVRSKGAVRPIPSFSTNGEMIRL
jgi:hypothetical protein